MKRNEISCEQLIHLYLDEQVSAPKVAKQLGCSVGTIYTRLEECGIETRGMSDAARLDRGVELACDELRVLYKEQTLSIYEIANQFECSPVTIHRQLKRCGITARPAGGDEFEYAKKDFDGDLFEKAYLLGFRQGDLHVERGNWAIRVRCTSTRQEQIDLVQSLFSEYGGIWISKPRPIRGTAITAHLNLSFGFLVPKQDAIEQWILEQDNLFAAYWAGYIDAEGSFVTSGKRVMFKVDSCDKGILHNAWHKLNQMGFDFPPPRVVHGKGIFTGRLWSTCDLWRVASEKTDTLLKLCKLLEPYLRHRKRIRDLQRIKIILQSRKRGNA